MRNAREYFALAIATACFAAGCATQPGIDRTYSAAGQDSRIQLIVLHFTSIDFAESIQTLTRGEVSAHYLVRDDPPTVYQLVDDARRAWHAGESSWQGATQLNASSIGIEIVNRGDRDGEWAQYPERQIDAVIALVSDLVRKYGLKPDHVVGHSDIAPQRKVDPGPRFPWKRLADAGLAEWPAAALVSAKREAYEKSPPTPAWYQEQLACVGYAVARTGVLDEDTRKVLAAFQMHFRPSSFDGAPDAESAALLGALAATRAHCADIH